jgi:hypothetical protein
MHSSSFGHASQDLDIGSTFGTASCFRGAYHLRNLATICTITLAENTRYLTPNVNESNDIQEIQLEGCSGSVVSLYHVDVSRLGPYNGFSLMPIGI